jgi:hypothetical protein
MMTKQAHAEALQKIAAIDERDRNVAYEAGFMKAAQDADLTKEEYALVYAEALKRLAPKKG